MFNYNCLLKLTVISAKLSVQLEILSTTEGLDHQVINSIQSLKADGLQTAKQRLRPWYISVQLVKV